MILLYCRQCIRDVTLMDEKFLIGGCMCCKTCKSQEEYGNDKMQRGMQGKVQNSRFHTSWRKSAMPLRSGRRKPRLSKKGSTSSIGPWKMMCPAYCTSSALASFVKVTQTKISMRNRMHVQNFQCMKAHDGLGCTPCMSNLFHKAVVPKHHITGGPKNKASHFATHSHLH